MLTVTRTDRALGLAFIALMSLSLVMIGLFDTHTATGVAVGLVIGAMVVLAVAADRAFHRVRAAARELAKAQPVGA